jgi:hypothetical protein
MRCLNCWKRGSGRNPAVEIWLEPVRGLMARSPSQMIAALRESGALRMCCLKSLACSGFRGSAAIRRARIWDIISSMRLPRPPGANAPLGGALDHECRQDRFATRTPAVPVATSLPPPVSATIRIAVGARRRRAHLNDQRSKCDLCLSPLRKVNVGE